MLNKLNKKLVEVIKSYHPKAIKESWALAEQRRKDINLLSQETGLKKIYFEGMSEEKINQELRLIRFKDMRLDNHIYYNYRNYVKGNKDISKEQARLKLIRNLVLAEESEGKRKHQELYKYGNLWMLVVGKRIVWLRNHTDKSNGFMKDVVRYNELNKELGINE